VLIVRSPVVEIRNAIEIAQAIFEFSLPGRRNKSRTYAFNIIFRLSYNDRCFLTVGAYFEVQPQDAPRLNLFAKEDRCVSPKIAKTTFRRDIIVFGFQ